MIKAVPKSVFRRLDKLEREDRDSVTSWVFLIASAEGFKIKIGTTDSLPRRLRDLETSTGQVLKGVRAWKTERAKDIKQRVLAALQECRQEGDWLDAPGVFERAASIIDGMLGKAGK